MITNSHDYINVEMLQKIRYKNDVSMKYFMLCNPVFDSTNAEEPSIKGFVRILIYT